MSGLSCVRAKSRCCKQGSLLDNVALREEYTELFCASCQAEWKKQTDFSNRCTAELADKEAVLKAVIKGAQQHARHARAEAPRDAYSPAEAPRQRRSATRDPRVPAADHEHALAAVCREADKKRAAQTKLTKLRRKSKGGAAAATKLAARLREAKEDIKVRDKQVARAGVRVERHERARAKDQAKHREALAAKDAAHGATRGLLAASLKANSALNGQLTRQKRKAVEAMEAAAAMADAGAHGVAHERGKRRKVEALGREQLDALERECEERIARAVREAEERAETERAALVLECDRRVAGLQARELELLGEVGELRQLVGAAAFAASTAAEPASGEELQLLALELMLRRAPPSQALGMACDAWGTLVRTAPPLLPEELWTARSVRRWRESLLPMGAALAGRAILDAMADPSVVCFGVGSDGKSLHGTEVEGLSLYIVRERASTEVVCLGAFPPSNGTAAAIVEGIRHMLRFMFEAEEKWAQRTNGMLSAAGCDPKAFKDVRRAGDSYDAFNKRLNFCTTDNNSTAKKVAVAVGTSVAPCVNHKACLWLGDGLEAEPAAMAELSSGRKPVDVTALIAATFLLIFQGPDKHHTSLVSTLQNFADERYPGRVVERMDRNVGSRFIVNVTNAVPTLANADLLFRFLAYGKVNRSKAENDVFSALADGVTLSALRVRAALSDRLFAPLRAALKSKVLRTTYEGSAEYVKAAYDLMRATAADGTHLFAGGAAERGPVVACAVENLGGRAKFGYRFGGSKRMRERIYAGADADTDAHHIAKAICKKIKEKMDTECKELIRRPLKLNVHLAFAPATNDVLESILGLQSFFSAMFVNTPALVDAAMTLWVMNGFHHKAVDAAAAAAARAAARRVGTRTCADSDSDSDFGVGAGTRTCADTDSDSDADSDAGAGASTRTCADTDSDSDAVADVGAMAVNGVEDGGVGEGDDGDEGGDEDVVAEYHMPLQSMYARLSALEKLALFDAGKKLREGIKETWKQRAAAQAQHKRDGIKKETEKEMARIRKAEALVLGNPRWATVERMDEHLAHLSAPERKEKLKNQIRLYREVHRWPEASAKNVGKFTGMELGVLRGKVVELVGIALQNPARVEMVAGTKFFQEEAWMSADAKEYAKSELGRAFH